MSWCKFRFLGRAANNPQSLGGTRCAWDDNLASVKLRKKPWNRHLVESNYSDLTRPHPKWWCRLTFIYLWTCRNPILMLYIFGVTVCRSLFQMLEVEWWTNGWSRDVPISSRAPTCRRFGKFRDLRRSGVFSGLKVVRAAVTLRSARKGVRKGGGLVREIPLFQGNLGWWNIVIWPDLVEST